MKGTTTTKETTSKRRRTGERAEPQTDLTTSAPSNLTTQTETITPDERAIRKLIALRSDQNTPVDVRVLLGERIVDFTNTAGVSSQNPALTLMCYRIACEQFNDLKGYQREVAAQEHALLLEDIAAQPDPTTPRVDATPARILQSLRDACWQDAEKMVNALASGEYRRVSDAALSIAGTFRQAAEFDDSNGLILTRERVLPLVGVLAEILEHVYMVQIVEGDASEPSSTVTRNLAAEKGGVK